MNFEKENKPIIIKILDIPTHEIGLKLENLGARRKFDRVMTRTLIFDHANLRLRKTGKVLRLREVGKKTFLSIKEGKEGASHDPFHKVQDAELIVSDFNQAFRLFESLGFSAFRYQEKLRSVYTLGSLTIELDEYPKIPAFMQISGPNQDMIQELLTKLGYKWEDGHSLSSLDILRRYGLKDIDIIRFENIKPGEEIN